MRAVNGVNSTLNKPSTYVPCLSGHCDKRSSHGDEYEEEDRGPGYEPPSHCYNERERERERVSDHYEGLYPSYQLTRQMCSLLWRLSHPRTPSEVIPLDMELAETQEASLLRTTPQSLPD